ncbi:type II toxin-antitoxin system death-on-curing family toxin [Lysinibacillus sp. BSL11]
MEEIVYLEALDIYDAHKIGFEKFGGTIYHVDKPCIGNRAIEPQTEYYGEEQYPGLFKKAAVYMLKINISHCFKDGNKRASIISTDLFLKYNGYKFNVSDDDLYEFALLIGNHDTRPTLEEVEQWIIKNVVPYEINEEELWDLL